MKIEKTSAAEIMAAAPFILPPAPEGIRLVFLESPFAGATEDNKTYAALAMRHSIISGEAPFASHLLYTIDGILDDAIASERHHGMAMGFAWARFAAATVVYADLGISEGMKIGMEDAARAGRPVEIRRILG